jgi:hypothetical protein
MQASPPSQAWVRIPVWQLTFEEIDSIAKTVAKTVAIDATWRLVP